MKDLKNYTVILTYCVNMSRDVDLDKPETANAYFDDIDAYSAEQAVSIAKDRFNKSVWESDVYEN